MKTINDLGTFISELALASERKLQELLKRHSDPDMLSAIEAELSRRDRDMAAAA